MASLLAKSTAVSARQVSARTGAIFMACRPVNHVIRSFQSPLVARRARAAPPVVASTNTARESGAPTATATVPMPVVKIDNVADAFATVVTVEFGDRLGELLDTVTSLKNLGLNIRRAKLDGAPGRQSNAFFVTDELTSEKILRSSRIEEIRMTIINNLLHYHPESSEQLAAGSASVARRRAGQDEPSSPLGPRGVVQTTVEVTEATNGSCSVVAIETPDRPGLLVDIVHTLKDINVNVVSAEIETVGVTAKDTLFVTYGGEPLNGPMVQLATNALQYYLALAEEESY